MSAAADKDWEEIMRRCPNPDVAVSSFHRGAEEARRRQVTVGEVRRPIQRQKPDDDERDDESLQNYI